MIATDPAPSLEQLAGLRRFQAPSNLRASWQVASTFGPYLMLVAAMYAALRVSVWLTLLLALLRR